jgi:hypothetical protein
VARIFVKIFDLQRGRAHQPSWNLP